MKIQPRDSRRRWALRALVLVGSISLFAGCGDVLDVDNPSLVTPGQVEGQTTMLDKFVAGIEANWRIGYGWNASSGAAMTDETIFGHGWTPWNEYDRRKITPQGITSLGYPFITAAIASGELYTKEVEKLAGPDSLKSAPVAAAYAYTGYSYLSAAQLYCQVVIDGSAQEDAAAYARAVELLHKAADVASAAGVDSIAHMANLGIAKAYLDLGQRDSAIVYAQKVPANWSGMWVRYTFDADFNKWTFYNLYKRTAGFKSTVEFNQGVAPQEAWKLDTRNGGTLPDLRTPYQTDSLTTLMGGWNKPRYAYVPYVPSQFSSYTPGNSNLISEDDDIRFASGLEAQYIIAEASLNGGAGGWSEGQVRDFVDARRRVGAPDAGDYAGDDLFAELRHQKLLDFYLAGFRYPDLRRYLNQYGINEFPTGPLNGFVGTAAPEDYGTDTCWPISPLE
ncbi:MAG TPA: hypothetical protein VFI96_04805 [Longimicrobiaceae bacterium]|nr:hypothetical protein [Longimicrobiaceae bacterium]